MAGMVSAFHGTSVAPVKVLRPTLRSMAELVVRIASVILDFLPTDHGLGGQPPAVDRTLEPLERRTRPAPVLTAPPVGVSR